MNDHAPNQLAMEPDLEQRHGEAVNLLRRTAKVAGDVLWWSFLSVIFASITIGVATELLF